MNVVDTRDDVIPLLEEVVRVEKRTIETGRVNLSINTEEKAERLLDELVADRVDITRIPIGRFVDVAPEPRQDGDATIIPLVEEVMVKRLFLREEVRIARRREVTGLDETVILRRQTASVERAESSTPNPSFTGDER